MKKLLQKIDPNIISIVCLIIIWKVLLFFVLIISFEVLPLYSKHLLGGGIDKYQYSYYTLPWANFDGEHFLSLAQFGYQQYTQAFFPLYPFFLSIFSGNSENIIINLAFSGLLISSISFILALIFLYKLLKLDYDPKFGLGVIFLLLLYPASFFFNAVYTESLFLMLITGSFYFFRKKNFLIAGIFGFLASLTRVFGVLLFFSFIIEILIYKIPIRKSFWIFLIPLGLISYMIYLHYSIGDPLAFYNLQLIVGEQHERGIVLFPQIIFRYLKILFEFSLTPLYTTVLFELAVGILFFILPIVGIFKKIRWSYLFFAFFGYILPTIQGSFSSLPRYVLILFPSFIILGLLIKSLPKFLKISLGLLSLFLLIIETGFFLRGYWVA